MRVNRRRFLTVAGATAGAALLPVSAKTLKSIGLQLYTLRTILTQNPLEIMRTVAQIGYREAELTTQNLDQVLAAVKQTAVRPVSLHMDNALFLHQQEKLPGAIEDAGKRGFSYVVCPYVPPGDRGGADVVKKLAETMNKAGEMARAAKMRLCYHNHAFDFAPSGNGTLLDVLLNATDAKLVGLELDIMWSQVAGVDPVSVIRKYGSRVDMMHLKNLRTAMPKQYTEQIPATSFAEVGSGVVNVPAVLAAASKAGVKHYFVEQDQTPGNPIDSIRASYGYLQKLNF